jgi:hypothetical protein
MSDNFRFFIVVTIVTSSLGWMGAWSWEKMIEADEKAGLYGSWPVKSWQEQVHKWREAGRPGPRPRFY